MLTGGSAATFYAPEGYQSRDIDFVMLVTFSGQSEVAALEQLGFQLSTGQTYKHSENPFTMDFIKDHLMIGSQPAEYQTIQRKNQLLNVLTPESCICDRLVSAIYYNDFSALNAAAQVNIAKSPNLQTIENWCAREQQPQANKTFARFLDLSKTLTKKAP